VAMTRWTAIVPVKSWRAAKSRLQAPGREGLARAFALDVLAALDSSELIGRVIVVSNESELGAGHAIVGDPGSLNGAVEAGRDRLLSEGVAGPVVVVPADLAALTVDALDAVLNRMVDHEASFV